MNTQPSQAQMELASPAQAAEIYAMMEKAKKEGVCSWDETYPSLDIVAEDIANRRLYTLRREDGGLLACITIPGEEDADMDLPEAGWSPAVRPAEASRLCVSPALQGQGIGSRMMRLALERARELGHDYVRLLASVDNPAANRVYQRLGFRRAGKVFLYDAYFWCYEMKL